ncbi:MAG: hypothetical protein ACKVSF_01475 [Alphaproteobacteria bacterium]
MAWLKGLIIFMGVLIVLGLGVMAVTIANRGGKMAADGPRSAVAGGFGKAVLDIGAGCEIAKTHVDSGRLVVRVDGPGGCRKILVVDLATGAVSGQLDIAPAK